MTLFGTENGGPYLVDFEKSLSQKKCMSKIYFYFPKMFNEKFHDY